MKRDIYQVVWNDPDQLTLDELLEVFGSSYARYQFDPMSGADDTRDLAAFLIKDRLK